MALWSHVPIHKVLMYFHLLSFTLTLKMRSIHVMTELTFGITLIVLIPAHGQKQYELWGIIHIAVILIPRIWCLLHVPK